MLRSRLLLISAAVLWSTSGLLIKSPALVALPLADRGLMLACYRALFAAVVMIPFVRLRAIRWRPMLLPMIASFAAMNLLFVTSMTRTSAAAAIFLQYTSVVWASLLGRLFLGERITRGNLVAMIFAVCGIVWIVSHSAESRLTGNLIALGSGLSYAGVIFCLRYLRDEDSLWLVSLNHAVSGLLLLPWVLSLGISLGPSQWSLAAVLGVFQMGLPYLLFARGVRSVRTQEAALLTLLEPILNPVWVLLFWGEPVGTATWLGGAMILGGLAARYLLFSERSA